MRARVYAAETGRFLSADPINLISGDLNVYRYGNNTPTYKIDPHGLAWVGESKGFGWPHKHIFFDKPVTITVDGAPRKITDIGFFPRNPYLDWRGELRWGYDPEDYQPIGNAKLDDEIMAQAVEDVGPWSWWIPPFSDCGFWTLAVLDRYIEIQTQIAGSTDPNTKIGPTGFATNGYISLNGVLAYRIDFENETNATAPAQIVQVTDQLSTNLDWSTFQLTEIGFGDHLITVPLGSQYYETTVPMSYSGVDFEVWIMAGIDLASGEVYAEFYSLDPATELPPNVLIGFLPPEDGTGRGMGHVSYTVLAQSGLPTGTQIHNVADVQFDQGEVIATNQRDPHNPGAGIDPGLECLNTIDASPPTSHVLPLPATTNVTVFLVEWTGQDDANGSGVQSYDLYVSDNGGAWTQWLTRSTNTSAVFTGQSSHTYAFYSVARDNVGNLEPAHSAADTVVSVVPMMPTLRVSWTNSQIIISWPLWAQESQLESTANLISSNNWQAVTNAPVIVGDQNAVTLDTLGPSKFYRLRKP
jgi:hypothetical protein